MTDERNNKKRNKKNTMPAGLRQRFKSQPSPTKTPELEGGVIRFDAQHADDGFAVLMSHGQVGIVGEDAYAVGREHIARLRAAGIPYELVTH